MQQADTLVPEACARVKKFCRCTQNSSPCRGSNDSKASFLGGGFSEFACGIVKSARSGRTPEYGLAAIGGEAAASPVDIEANCGCCCCCCCAASCWAAARSCSG